MLNSSLLPIHVSVIILAYFLLLLCFVTSFVALFWTKKRQGLRVLSQFMLYPALTFLGYGIFIGAIWANLSWGTYWSWDPKETWALITLMIYAVPAHKSFSNQHYKHRAFFFYHLYMVLAFLAILMTYFGVNYFLGGMHSYA